jgi:hypothetical protein
MNGRITAVKSWGQNLKKQGMAWKFSQQALKA